MLSRKSQIGFAEYLLSRKGVPARAVSAAAEVACSLLLRSYFDEEVCRNEVLVTPYVKRVIAERGKMKGVSTVNSGMKTLLSCGLLTQVEPGVYRFSGEFAGDHDWRSIVAIRVVKSFEQDSEEFLQVIYPDTVAEWGVTAGAALTDAQGEKNEEAEGNADVSPDLEEDSTDPDEDAYEDTDEDPEEEAYEDSEEDEAEDADEDLQEDS